MSTFFDAVQIPTGLPCWSQKAAALFQQPESRSHQQTASVRLAAPMTALLRITQQNSQDQQCLDGQKHN